ncbi:reverse transcriptase domain-containing protein [Tanacetum coccineum]
MVKKHDGTWRMCVDFKDLNNACPKDCYPLPEIDWKVESLCGYSFKCFLDAYKGYHQIKMAKEDEEKTAFITSQGIFCYSKMPFGLKNAGSTYQRLVDKAFQRQIGRNLEVYVDDLVIKSHTEEEIIRDVTETFKTLRQINMKLNPKKCTFGMQEGMFLGYKVSTNGLKACPDKADAVLSLPSPRCIKDVQKLNGKLASLNRFLSKSAEKSLPFFKTLKNCTKKSDFQWTPEAEEAFKQMKKLIAELPTLTAPREREELIIYLAAAKEAIKPEVLPEPWMCSQTARHAWTAPGQVALISPKESGMVQYLNKVKTLAKSFKEFSIKQIPRSENKKADALSKIASTSFAHLNKQDKKKARAVRRKAAKYAMINGTLYKKSFLGPWLRCVGPLQANYVLREIHEGSCSMHSGPRSVVAKVIQTGYYWPTMHMDARNLIRECNDCQNTSPVPRNPQQNLTPITSPWPFYKWGIDIAGPFPEGPGKVKFLIVAIDYFTKWIEAKAVATITGNQVKKFVWDNIVCRFGLPGEIISDNGKQFRDNPFKDWCEKLCIRQHFASVKHPQANGLVERANRSLGEGIKARLDERSRDWIEELPHVLWAHRTMIKSSNGETPFSLTYGTEAVIPAEIGMPTLRTAEVDQAKNNEALGINLDLIEEKREQAAIQEAKSKKKMEKYYNSRVRGTSFKPGDMVYRSNEASHAQDGGKLGPKWEGPYEVKESLGRGAYKLKDRKGNDMPRTWNICNLKKCYIHEM